MARRPDPDSVPFLKRQVVELSAVNDAFANKLSETAKLLCEYEDRIELLTVQNAGLTDERAQAEKDLLYWKGLRQESSEFAQKAITDAKRYEGERDKARQDLQAARWTLVGVERERDAARALADAMRQRAFPTGPEFPWEQRRSTEETVHMHYTAERA